MSIRVKRLVKARIGKEKFRMRVRATNNHTYAYLVSPEGHTLTEISTMSEAISKKVKHGANKDAAKVVGKAMGDYIKKKKITNIAFDRSGRLYHGRVAAIADGAREVVKVF